MKRTIAMAVTLLALSGAGYANCGNDNGNGNGCSDNEGTTGPRGLPGPGGTNGTNGTNGVDGVSNNTSTNGTNGRDGAYAPTKLVLDSAIRLYDGKRVQWQVFDVLQLDRRAQHDVIGGATNDMFGVRFVFKLGPDYATGQIEALNRKLDALERIIARLQ